MKTSLFILFVLWLSTPVHGANLRLLNVEVENPSDTTKGLSVRFTLALGPRLAQRTQPRRSLGISKI